MLFSFIKTAFEPQGKLFLQEEKALQSSQAFKRLAEAAKVERELKHELGKVKFVVKELQDAYRAAFAEKEAALRQVL